jgi:hypothetical protein
MGQTKIIGMEKLIFDKNRKRIKYCPCCGHDNKKGGYVPYIGTTSGYCNYCGSSCFPNKNGTLVTLDKRPVFKKKKETSFIDSQRHERSLKNYGNNDFVNFLLGQFGKHITPNIIKRYRLGTEYRNVIFWQIDIDKKIRTGKIMEYNPGTGKRQKYINWVHSGIEDFNLDQCLFGEHLLFGSDKKVAIVESEKTACIMSECNPEFIWLATGGSSSGIDKKFKALYGRPNEVVLFPDQGKFDEWEKLRETHLKFNSTVSYDCELWFNNGEIEKGDDIADYYLKKYGSNGLGLLKPEPKYIDPQWDDFVIDNPHLNLKLTAQIQHKNNKK